VGAGIIHWPPLSRWPEGDTPTWCSLNPMNLSRAAMLRKLRRYPGRQLVILHYGQDHTPFFNEWVYNRADLNSAKVIWARDMGPAKNQELIDYYKQRRVWLVYADDKPPKLVPYPEAADRATSSERAR